ncbi:fibronectin type III domain-containing protein [Dehalococcoidia bacterium]|nr:fibronectin type III domain-containing protein [Dehalococcoidia bacterium]
MSDKATTAHLEYSEFFGEIWSPVVGLETVSVRITTNPDSSSVVEFLSQRGASISFSGESLIYADVPSDILIPLSQREDVHMVSPVTDPVFEEIVSEGSSIHGASTWNFKGYTGTGVKVGIIDNGFIGFSTLMGSELPSTVTARCYLSNGTNTSNLSDCESYSNHGTAVSEVIYDLAPDAELYIAKVGGAQIDITNAAEWMISQGVQVINMSLGPYHSYGPGDGTYLFTDSPLYAIDTAVAGGAVWVNSAGNYVGKNWYGDVFSDLDGDGWVEIYPHYVFTNSFERNCFNANAGDDITAILRWDDDWPGAINNFGLYLYWDLIPGVYEIFLTGSDLYQYGLNYHLPFEAILGYEAPGDGRYCFKIRNNSMVNTSSWLQLQFRGLDTLTWYGHNISRDGAYSVNAPSESSNPGMLSVAAAHWENTNVIAPYSSQGPTVDGRQKPDITGVSNANSASKGNWIGTSQASPHVAALAALVAEKFPSFSPSQIASYLKGNASRRGESTPNNEWGYGLASLPSLTPDSPTNVAATTTLGVAKAVINWNAPSADGGEYISQYIVSGSPGDFIATTTPFGSSGKVITDISANGDTLSSSAVDADGRLIFVGETHNGSNYDFVVARYTAYGVLDTSFGEGGITTTAFGNGDDKATDVILDSSGRIVVSGYSYNGSDYDFAVARYDTDGNLDTTFSTDGKKTIDFYSNTDVAEAIALDGYGNIIVAGYAYAGDDVNAAAARIDSNGTLDTSFSDDGKNSIGFGNAIDIAWDVTVDSTNRVILAGETNANGSDEDAALFRLTASGALDTSFSLDGGTHIDHGTDANRAYSVSLDSQDKLIIAGSANNGADLDFSLFRINSDGTVDSTFTATLTDFSLGSDIAKDSYIDGNGKIMLSGFSVDDGTSDFALARFNSDGTLDASFGNSGRTTVDFGSSDDRSYSVLGLSNGNILAAGNTDNGVSEDFALARLDSIGNLDSGLTTTISGLSPGTPYSFTVLAENSVGTSTSSSVSNSVTPIVVPGIPTMVSAISGNGQAQITWTAPTSDGGSEITLYSISSNVAGVTATTTDTSHSLTGLANGVTYLFTVVASNIAGAGEVSGASAPITPAAVPESPGSVSGTSGDGQVTVSWTAPNENGSAITLYTVTATSGAFTATSTATSIVVTGLDNGTPYSFIVIATNSAGDSPPSAASSSVTPMGIPGTPTSVTASSGASVSANIDWNAPSSKGGGIDYYTVTSSPGSIAVSSTTTTATLTGLTNGTTYTFTVTSTNSIGTSISSVASNSVTPAAFPDAPTGVIASAGNSQVIISWIAANDNGSSVNYYTVTADTGFSATTTATSSTITGLENGTSYSFIVTAANGIGIGPSSSPTPYVMPLTIPSVPTTVTATSTSAESAEISWEVSSSDGGSAIIHYTVTSSPAFISATTTSTSLTVTDLTNGTSYTFTVSASNITGTSSPSVASNSITPTDVPGIPTNVVAIGGDKQVTVSWSAPSDNGSAISLYTVSVIPAGLNATTTGTSALIQNLNNGSTYRFRIVATNSIGNSQPSNLSNIVMPAPTDFTVEAVGKNYSNEGQSTTYNIAVFRMTSATTTVTSTINWGDGISSVGDAILSGLDGTVSGTHAYQENGTYSVTVTVTTDTGMTESAIGLIEIFNVDPSVTLEKFAEAGLGNFASPRATYSDDGVQDTHTAEIDWGDGATSTLAIDNSDNSIGGNHVYSYPGSYVVTLSVADDDGGVGSATTSLLIAQPATVVSIPGMTLWVMYLSAITIAVISFWLFRRRVHS